MAERVDDADLARWILADGEERVLVVAQATDLPGPAFSSPLAVSLLRRHRGAGLGVADHFEPDQPHEDGGEDPELCERRLVLRAVEGDLPGEIRPTSGQ